MARDNLGGVHPSVCHSCHIRDGKIFDKFGKMNYEPEEVFFPREVVKYGPVLSMDVTSKGFLDSSTSPSGAISSLSSFPC